MKNTINNLIRYLKYRTYFDRYHCGNKSGLNILVITQEIGATYYINFETPLKLLYQEGDINYAVLSEKKLTQYKETYYQNIFSQLGFDIVVLSRCAHKKTVTLLRFFKHAHIPVIYHIDDDLLKIPDCLGENILRKHGNQDVITRRITMLEESTLIYASTDTLRATLQSRFPHQTFFQGISSPFMKGHFPKGMSMKRERPVIGYMGTKGHQSDLEIILPSLIRLLNERQEIHFELLGTIQVPKALHCFGCRIRHYPPKPYHQLLTQLDSLNWTVGLIPLQDIAFNRTKTPIKFVDYTACNIPTLASNVSVYHMNESLNNTILVKENWYEEMKLFLDNGSVREYALNLAIQYCNENYNLSLVLKQLRGLFSIG